MAAYYPLPLIRAILKGISCNKPRIKAAETKSLTIDKQFSWPSMPLALRIPKPQSSKSLAKPR